MAKSKKVVRKVQSKYDPMNSSIVQVGIVFIIISALALAYIAGAMR